MLASALQVLISRVQVMITLLGREAISEGLSLSCSCLRVCSMQAS